MHNQNNNNNKKKKKMKQGTTDMNKHKKYVQILT